MTTTSFHIYSLLEIFLKSIVLNSSHSVCIITKSEFLELENTQLRKLIEEQVASPSNLVSARVMLDKTSPYLNSFIINTGSNKNVKNGMAALDGNG